MHSSLLALLVAVPTLFAAPALFSAPSGLIDAVKIAVNDAVDGTVGADDGDLIPDKWIVNLEDATSKEFARTVISVANGILQTREFSLEGFLGFALDGNFEDITALIEQLPGIKNIEQDRYIAPHDFVSQSDVNWGLARVSDQSSDEYFYDESGGEGTYAYIVDSGIYTDHVEFGGRASMAANFIDDEDDEDVVGHGTHVAGIVGSETYGVAKKINLIGVKVFGEAESTATSTIISAVEWVVNDAKDNDRAEKSVLNLSLGGGYSSAFSDAIAAATDAGLFVAVSAGNNGQDVSGYSPASAPTACTVGAINPDDKRPGYSNYGDLIDIFAPGNGILSTFIGSDTETRIFTGTSMSSPFVAGLAAYLMALEGGIGRDMCARIQELALEDVIDDTEGSVNLLAYNGYESE